MRDRDLSEDVELSLALEGRSSGAELEDEHAQRPPVHRHAVAVAVQYLGRHVLRRAAQRQAVLTGAEHRRQPEVNELQVTSAVEQQILRLEIAVDDLRGGKGTVRGCSNVLRLEIAGDDLRGVYAG